MEHLKKRFILLWAGLGIVMAIFVFGQESFFRTLNIDNYLDRAFADRHWLGFKQHYQRSYQKSFKPSSHVRILQLNYSNRTDFWFDEETRKDLSEKLMSYEGPIVTSFDPIRVLRDPYLSKLLEKPNFVRPFRIEQASTEEGSESFSVMEQLSHPIEQPTQTIFGTIRKIEPKDPAYFQGKYFLGSLHWKPDDVSHFVYDYHLTAEASKFQVPSLALASLAPYHGCESYRYSQAGEVKLLKCRDAEELTYAGLQNQLPIFFYTRPPVPATLQELPTQKEILIVEVVDSASYFQNLLGSKNTFGELVSTVLSNILEGHVPKKDDRLEAFQKALFCIFLLILIWGSFQFRLRIYFQVSILLVLAYFVSDFLMTFIWNFRTYPVEELISLGCAAFIGVGMRSVGEYEERRTIERALSGYVNEKRLSRLVSGKEKLSLEGRKAELTTMIVDISRFAQVTADLSIEDVFGLMQDFYSIIDPIVFQFGGIIDKKTGDGLLAFFGDELEGEDMALNAALSAVRAGVQIQKALKTSTIQPKLTVRIGINTGEMMVGNTGSQKHFNYTVLGEPVNFTQRLEAACEPGSILIGQATAEFVGKKFELKKKEIHVKHEDKTFPCYEVQLSL